MPATIQPATIQFLTELVDNNTREWFAENKPRYEKGRKDFMAFLDEVLHGMQDFEPEIARQQAKDTVFRIYRDVRFSNDKRPFKDHFGSYLCVAGRKSWKPGYYFHLKPGSAFIAGGAWFPPAPELKAIRQEIDYNFEELNSILQSPEFRKYFSGLEGEKLKTNPKGYTAENPAIELLRMKSFNAVHNLPDKLLTSDELLPYTLDVLRTLKPVNDFLMRAFEES